MSWGSYPHGLVAQRQIALEGLTDTLIIEDHQNSMPF
jgi:hypothetical protein